MTIDVSGQVKSDVENSRANINVLLLMEISPKNMNGSKMALKF